MMRTLRGLLWVFVRREPGCEDAIRMFQCPQLIRRVDLYILVAPCSNACSLDFEAVLPRTWAK